MRIEQIAREIRLSGDTVFSDGNGPHSGHDDNRLSLDGKETLAGPVSLSFRRIDDSTFDIISKVHIHDRNLTEVSRFLFSTEGRVLAETKTQTEVLDQAAGARTKASRSVLVFRKFR
ncbi:MAG: hypothetical protein WBE37_28250 [Bryobacteraceae bacterium]